MNLIFDRTAEDVQAARTQRGTTLTPLKGCYNIADFNRVEQAVKTLAAALTSAGYPVEVMPVLKGSKSEDREWQEGDVLYRPQWTTYLSNVQRLRDAYYTLAETGELPAATDKLGWQGANTIEKILADIDLLIGWMKSSYRRCGTFNSGENSITLPLKGSV